MSPSHPISGLGCGYKPALPSEIKFRCYHSIICTLKGSHQLGREAYVIAPFILKPTYEPPLRALLAALSLKAQSISHPFSAKFILYDPRAHMTTLNQIFIFPQPATAPTHPTRHVSSITRANRILVVHSRVPSATPVFVF